MNTVLPLLGMIVFLAMSVWWVVVVRRPESRASRLWYGPRWGMLFAPERRQRTIQQGYLLAVLYFAICLMQAAILINLHVPAARGLAEALIIPLIILSTVLFVIYLVLRFRRS
ncbi:MAG TPA: hypothetical protein VFS21_16445 [Roseiflexaceae bacterium]|nr:hypothetical protein [Roseiflexaceae bacterium]